MNLPLLVATIASPSNVTAHNVWAYLMNCKEDITLFIALAGFALSSGQLIYALWNKRAKFSIEVQNHEMGMRSDHVDHIFLLAINNLSTNPLVITRIVLIKENRLYPCYLTHQWCGERYYPNFPETDIPRTEHILSVDFPLHLTGQQSFLGFISFPVAFSECIPDNDSKLTFKIVTNRGFRNVTVTCPSQNNNSMFV